MDKRFLRQDRYFSTRLPHAIKKITENFFHMVKTKYDTTVDMIKSYNFRKVKQN